MYITSLCKIEKGTPCGLLGERSKPLCELQRVVAYSGCFLSAVGYTVPLENRAQAVLQPPITQRSLPVTTSTALGRVLQLSYST